MTSPEAADLDTSFYRLAYPDLAALSDEQLTVHWIASGSAEGRIPSPVALAERFGELGLSPDDFDPVLYLKVNVDLTEAGVREPLSAAVHFVHSGHAEARIFRPSIPGRESTRPDDELFMWERSVITLRQWNELRTEAESDPALKVRRRLFTGAEDDAPLSSTPSRTNATHDAAVLVSLYRTDEYLDGYLGNMEEQTAFDRCVFDIVLVDPSQYEGELCEAFAARHGNVNLTIHSRRVGIYEAWNSSIRATQSRYVTVTCVDDLWGPRSLETQIEFLDAHPDVDVAYHDMYLSPVYGPSWDVVERIGFKTNLGGVTARSLLHEFNTPANAPMWRRGIHDRVGLFDETYESAGDWEFWIRCALGSVTFAKIDTINFCYFINDQGMSRGSAGPAAREAQRILETYAHLV